MPIQFKRCRCGEKIPRNLRSCVKCEAANQKAYDTTSRNQEAKAFYGSKAWWRVRTKVLMANPLCVVCNRPANVVDHIKEIKDNGALLLLENLQSMCFSCHNKKTAQEVKNRDAR